MRKPVAVVAAVWSLVGALMWDTAPPASAADSTLALQSKLNALKPGDTLTLDPGATYDYSNVLSVRVSGVRINGNGATLKANNPTLAALQILANNVTVNNLNLTGQVGAMRQDGPNQSRLVFGGTGVVISDVNITGGASAGVYVANGSNFRLDRVTVRDTAADGVQITAGSSNGQVNNVTVDRSGDDAIAVVSYLWGYPPAAPCSDIVINSPVVSRPGQRGVVVVGAHNVSISNPTVSSTPLSGIFIGSQGWPFFTAATSGVRVTGGKIIQGNNGGGVPTGAVTILSQNYFANVSDVTVSGLTITDTPKSAVANIGVAAFWAGPPTKVVLRDIAITQQPETSAVWANVARSNYTTSGFTMNGRPLTVP
ncbi:right-handed parallel beta-helix repeat-containing protein [Mycobacterium sp. B14F4]|uniref:right-handed parallel beta-helix repeat-containing protein n=1 Tax=Mycobacterium sp. B14F4 TaxID=3153565 RepID=UPI00325E1AC7